MGGEVLLFARHPSWLAPWAGDLPKDAAGARVSLAEIAQARDSAKHLHCIEYERGLTFATLSDALDWERLGLGRLRFVDGQPTWQSDLARGVATFVR